MSKKHSIQSGLQTIGIVIANSYGGNWHIERVTSYPNFEKTLSAAKEKFNGSNEST